MERLELLEKSMVSRKRAENSFSDQLGALRKMSKQKPGQELRAISQEISHRLIEKRLNGEEETTQAEEEDDDHRDTEVENQSDATSVSCAVSTRLEKNEIFVELIKILATKRIFNVVFSSSSTGAAMSNSGYFSRFNWSSGFQYKVKHDMAPVAKSENGSVTDSNTPRSSKNNNNNSSSYRIAKSKKKNKGKKKS